VVITGATSPQPHVLEAVRGASYDYARGIDHRDWSLYRDVFTDVCDFDFGVFDGRPPGPVPADDWTSSVRATIDGFDATQHLMSNHVVLDHDTDHVTMVNEVHAQHWISATTMRELGRADEAGWVVVGGHYTNRYRCFADRWRIERCTLTVRWRTGDVGLFAVARERAEAR
jgi:hypothetical protein